MRSFAICLALLLTGCRSHGGPDVVLESQVLPSVREEVLTAMDRELDPMLRFFGARDLEQPIRVTVESLDIIDSADLSEILTPHSGGVSGWAEGDEHVHLVVGIESYGIQLPTKLVRHELAHVVAFRVGLRGPIWFDEGLAEVMENCLLTEGGLLLFDPAPVEFYGARALSEELTPEDLLRWDGGEKEGSLRLVARSMVRFAMESAEVNDLAVALAPLCDLDAGGFAEFWGQWRGWLWALDLPARIRSGAGPGEVVVRRASGQAVPRLGEIEAAFRGGLPGVTPGFRNRLTGLALDLLADPVCGPPSLRFLYFYRREARDDERLAALVSSGEPKAVLLAALYEQRDTKGHDEERVRAAWDRLTKAERDGLGWVPMVLPGLQSSRR